MTDYRYEQRDGEPGFLLWLKRRPSESWLFFVAGILIGAILL